MRVMVTGHRLEKLQSYDISWIKRTILDQVELLTLEGLSLGMSGMASGVDLWFCDACRINEIPYQACVPFEGQDDLMDDESKLFRHSLIESAAEVKNVRNRYMVETCDAGLIVWDGNKGGTHNCFQQLMETSKRIRWIIPSRQQVVAF